MLTPSGKDQSTLVEVSRRPWDKIYKKEKELLKRYTAIRNQLKQLDLLPYKKGKAQTFTRYLYTLSTQELPRHHESLIRRFFIIRKQLDNMWVNITESEEEHSASDWSTDTS